MLPSHGGEAAIDGEETAIAIAGIIRGEESDEGSALFRAMLGHAELHKPI